MMTSPVNSLRCGLRPLLALLLVSLTLPMAALHAGSGPHNYLVVYDPNDLLSLSAARVYQEQREVPDRNMLPYDFPKHDDEPERIKRKINYEEGWQLILDLRAVIAERDLGHQINGIALVGQTPLNVGDASITTMLWFAPMFTGVADLRTAFEGKGYDYGRRNYAYRGPTGTSSGSLEPAVEVRHDVPFLTTGSVPQEETYWLATHVGYTGVRGLRAEEVAEISARSRNADATFPEGTLHWPCNDNIRSDIREWQIPGTAAEWDDLGLPYRIYGSFDASYATNPSIVSQGAAYIPKNAQQVTGAFTGSAQAGDLETANTTYTPGALADRLTSFGGVMGDRLFRSPGGQMSMASWLRNGCSGTSGTVNEPYAIWQKFPHARLYSHYFNGATLAEAYLQAVMYPRQLLVMGDPLCQPYAPVPVVSFSNLEEGETLSGSRTINVTADSSAGVEEEMDLAIDGRVIRIGDADESVDVVRTASGFRLNTRTLTDGCHEVRIIAYAENAVRSQGFATRRIHVNNTGGRITLTGPASRGVRQSVSVTVSPGGLAGATAIDLVAGGRLLASLPPSGGTVDFPAAQLSVFGTNAVVALARTSAGNVASEPLPVEVRWPALGSSDAATGDGLALARLFPDTSVPGFDWSEPAEEADVTDRGRLVFENAYDRDTGVTTVDFPMVTEEMLGEQLGMEFVTVFTADETALYDFAFSGGASLEFLIDGRRLLQVDSTGGNPVLVSEKLSAGKHELRFRVGSIERTTKFEVGVRAAHLRYADANGRGDVDYAPLTLALVGSPAGNRDLLVDGAFDLPATGNNWGTTPATAYAERGWYDNRHGTRPLQILDGALTLKETTHSTETIFQVVEAAGETGEATLEIDALVTDPAIRYAVYAYRGSDQEIDNQMAGDKIQVGGQLRANLASGDVLAYGDFSDFSEPGVWAVPFDLGAEGYDYLVVAFSTNARSAAGNLPIAERAALIVP